MDEIIAYFYSSIFDAMMFIQVLQLKKSFLLRYFKMHAKQRVVKSMLTEPYCRSRCYKVHTPYAIRAMSIISGGCEKALKCPRSFCCFLHRKQSAFEDWWILNILISEQFRWMCGNCIRGFYEENSPPHKFAQLFWEWMFTQHFGSICNIETINGKSAVV